MKGIELSLNKPESFETAESFFRSYFPLYVPIFFGEEKSPKKDFHFYRG
jgi:hypothetical protein